MTQQHQETGGAHVVRNSRLLFVPFIQSGSHLGTFKLHEEGELILMI